MLSDELISLHEHTWGMKGPSKCTRVLQAECRQSPLSGNVHGT